MRVVIGIQCRTNSARLPGKALMVVGNKTIIQHVIDACKESSAFLNRRGTRYSIYANVALLVPKNDNDLIDAVKHSVDRIYEGSENDVLSRYVLACNSTKDITHIVRITGDCLYIPSHVISRHIKYALKKKADYCTNVLERCNPEGWDCEVLSTRLVHWLDENAVEGRDREHVTSLIPTAIKGGFFPPRFKVCNSTDSIDLSHIKTSIDTPEDLDRACIEFQTRRDKNATVRKYGEVF